MTQRCWLAVLLAIFAGVVAGPVVAETAAPTFRHGATLVEFFQFPRIVEDGAVKRYADPAFPNAKAALGFFDFDELRRDGFDHMRLMIDLGPLLAGRGSQWNQIIDQLHFVIAALHRHGLGVIVTLLPPAPGGEAPTPQLDGLHGPNFEHYLAITERIAAELSTIKTGAIALEPMNEPQTECRASVGPDWTAYQEVVVASIRRLAPDLPLFLTGGCWSTVEGTMLLDTPLLRDPRNFVSVHFYIPYMFTHQTATWSMPFLAGVIGIPFPAAEGSVDRTLASTRARFEAINAPAFDKESQYAEAEKAIRWYFTENDGKATIDAWMKRLAAWQAREGVSSDRIGFTEFGAMKQISDGVEIDPASRARWLGDTSGAIERQGWGWTVFVLRNGPFALYRSDSDRGPEPELLRALRLSPTVH